MKMNVSFFGRLLLASVSLQLHGTMGFTYLVRTEITGPYDFELTSLNFVPDQPFEGPDASVSIENRHTTVLQGSSATIEASVPRREAAELTDPPFVKDYTSYYYEVTTPGSFPIVYNEEDLGSVQTGFLFEESLNTNAELLTEEVMFSWETPIKACPQTRVEVTGTYTRAYYVLTWTADAIHYFSDAPSTGVPTTVSGILEGDSMSAYTVSVSTFDLEGNPLPSFDGSCPETPIPTPLPTASPSLRPNAAPVSAPVAAPTSTAAPVAPPVAAPAETADSSSFCFSQAATVQVQNKGLVSMRDLQIGDFVLTSGQTYQPVYAFAHFEPTKMSEFLVIATSGLGSNERSSSLEITPGHLVFLEGNTTPIPAGMVKVGDMLQGQEGSLLVTHIGKVPQEGLYAPLTPQGFLLVNGIKASAYITLQDDTKAFLELQGGFAPISQHQFIHLSLSPFRMLCMATSASFCHDYNENGMPQYVASGIQLFKWLDASELPILVQLALLGIAALIFGFFASVEVFFGAIYYHIGTMAVVSLGVVASFGGVAFVETFAIACPIQNRKKVI